MFFLFLTDNLFFLRSTRGQNILIFVCLQHVHHFLLWEIGHLPPTKQLFLPNANLLIKIRLCMIVFLLFLIMMFLNDVLASSLFRNYVFMAILPGRLLALVFVMPPSSDLLFHPRFPQILEQSFSFLFILHIQITLVFLRTQLLKFLQSSFFKFLLGNLIDRARLELSHGVKTLGIADLTFIFIQRLIPHHHILVQLVIEPLQPWFLILSGCFIHRSFGQTFR